MFHIKHKNHGKNKDEKYRIMRSYSSYKEAVWGLCAHELRAYFSLSGIMENDELTEVGIFENDKWVDWRNIDFSRSSFALECICCDSVDHPNHYNENLSGVECIEVVERMNFNLGNAVKYIWRAGLKENIEENLKKAVWYIKRELIRMEKLNASKSRKEK